jgi:hypothetical protein
MSPLVTTELILGSVALLALAFVAFVWLRRRYIAGGRQLMLCALRTEAEPRWRLGLARLSGDNLEWFSVVGPSLRPEQTWLRHEFDLGAPAPVPETIPGLPPDAVAVSGQCGQANCSLAMSAAAYTALRAWLESSPPGFNVNVA